MTASLTKTIRQAGLMLAFAVSVSALSSTSSFAFSAEAQQMCTGDAFRLCSSEIPEIPAITACMVKHKADLSAGCRPVMDRNLARNPARSQQVIPGPGLPGTRLAGTRLARFQPATTCRPTPICALIVH